MNRLLLLLFFTLIQTEEIFAGPGGKIAKELFDTPLGKVVGVILFIVLLPLILRSWYKQNKSVKSTQSKLNALSRINHDLFDEVNLKNRVTDVFTRVHQAWSAQSVEDCEEYMTSWYRQNQQTVFLDEWKSKGLMNVCNLKKINKIQPIHLRLTENPDFEGTRIMFLINANMEDYLVKIDDSSVIEGKRGYKDVETVWTLQRKDGAWKVDNIEQAEVVSAYLKMDMQVTDAIIEKLARKHAAS